MLRQSNILYRQTRLNELGKKPVIRISKPEGEQLLYSYVVENLSSYPIKISDVSADYEPEYTKPRVIQSNSTAKIKFEKNPQKIRIEVSNLLDEGFSLNYLYDTRKDDLTLVEYNEPD